jgi:hypothetical protein
MGGRPHMFCAAEASAPTAQTANHLPYPACGGPRGLRRGRASAGSAHAGQRPSDRRDAVHQGGVILRLRCFQPRPVASQHLRRAVRPAPASVSTTARGVPTPAQGCAPRTRVCFNHGPWRPNTRAGLRAPHPRAGPAPPPRTGRCAPVSPRSWSLGRFARSVAHAVRRGARAVAGAWPFGRRGAPPSSHALPTARLGLPPCTYRSGGIRPSRTNCQPPPLPRPTLAPPRRRGQACASLRGSASAVHSRLSPRTRG